MRWSSIEHRLLEKVVEDIEKECWTIPTSGGNRPKIRVGSERLFASHVSYLLYVGEITEGLYVCHSCDNPNCINPNHLWLGTQKDNMQDCVKKNRLLSQKRLEKVPKGDNHWSIRNPELRIKGVKLTEEHVKYIRMWKNEGFSYSKIAKAFRIGTTQVRRVVKFESWRHV